MNDINDYIPRAEASSRFSSQDDRPDRSREETASKVTATNKLAEALKSLNEALAINARAIHAPKLDSAEAEDPALKAARVDGIRKLAAKLVAEGKTVDAVFVLRTLPCTPGQ